MSTLLPNPALSVPDGIDDQVDSEYHDFNYAGWGIKKRGSFHVEKMPLDHLKPGWYYKAICEQDLMKFQ